jgi:uncharacterized protein
MKISTFIHILDNKVWDAYNKKFIELSVDDINFIIKYKNQEIPSSIDIPANLLSTGIVTTYYQEKKLLMSLKEITKDRQFQSLYLICSTSCNLDCDYCFYRSSISNSLKHKQMMSFDVAKKSLDDFKEIVVHNVKDDNYWQQITFYGGEPLLNKEMLYLSIPYSYKLFGDETNLVINTNAVLLDDGDIELFKDNNVEVQVSLDGDKYFHNLHRKTYYGKPTYSIVLNNIKKLLNNGVKVLPMITATDDNVNDFSKILYSIINELKITDYAVNILITKSFNISNDYAGKLATEMLKAYESFGHIANDYVFVELYNKLLGIDKTISKNSCGSSRKITVFPNGKVYACQAMEKVKENAMGTINDEFISDSNWDCWRNRSRFDNPECLNCECVMSCGGGCATGSYNINGSIYDIDKNNCEYTRELFKKIHHI